ncbi:hypothetical protein SAMN02745119_01941 [Trichlorobacter thiogenes]|uniref:Uncharacterized protein n=1 Tax=Trichlorobacter thiogenes TaxID=115783 RepID=A0A1T4PCN0_9BACT|nr:hypothetical protein [Trichlorobacter thiogenes]SJZ89335.1 hypothetical protein SAMN02745119_01941 [Trichlorobacter thiogenes]
MGYRGVSTSILLFLMVLLTLPVAALARQDGPNPHKSAPKKRITDEMRQEAADARKGVSPEARKAAKASKAKKVKHPVAGQSAGSPVR